jgi:glutamate synthase (NADPH/NADH) small chain
MPGSAREVGHAEEEGIEFLWQAQPEAFLGTPVRIIAGEPTAITDDLPVFGVRAVRTRLSTAGPDGRDRPEVVPGSDFELPAEMVVNALGFSVEDVGLLSGGLVKMGDRGTVAFDRRTMMTCAEGVFVAGDAARGPSLAVWAIRDGRDVAASVHRFLLSRQETAGAAEAAAASRQPR